MNNLDLTEFMIKKLETSDSKEKKELIAYMSFHKSLCNEVLYSDKKYKETAIIITHLFNNLFSDFCKEVINCVYQEGVYKNE